jgi:phosphatidylserine decarboxylase
VTQFRKRVNSRSFHHNLKEFFCRGCRAPSRYFNPGSYVMMVEAGTEIKTGAGRVVLDGYRVKVD